MAYDRIPTSDKWREIANIQDENSQSRALANYVYDLEQKVYSQESALVRLRRENKEYKKEILSLSIVKDAINNAKSEAYKDCNTDWSGLQGGF